MVRGLKGKRGVSLVEEVCAIAILSIVVVGLLFVIGFSQTNIVSYNAQDKAAAQVQEVSDRVMAALAQQENASGSVISDSNVKLIGYNLTPGYSADKIYYSYKRIINDGTDSSKQITGYNILVTKYYSKTKYIKYKSYVSYTGKDV